MRINASATQFIPKATASQVLNTGPGKVYAIILTVDKISSIEASLTLYDNTAASGTILIRVNAQAYAAPVIIFFDKLMPLTFTTGLTATTSTYGDAFVIMEA